jgi:hypothetical protein
MLVMVDRLSKYSPFIPFKHPFTACSIIFLFVKDMVRLHGILESILSDGEPLFVSIFWKEVFKLTGNNFEDVISLSPSDGQFKMVNHCLEAYLCCFVLEQPKTWVHWIPWGELWYV